MTKAKYISSYITCREIKHSNLKTSVPQIKINKLTLYVRQQKGHRCIEQSFGLCGRGRGWDDLGEWH